MNQRMRLSDWKVDNSAGRPILTYKDCSVIEADDAEFVLSAIKAALSAAEPVRCEGCDGYNCDDGCAYPVPEPSKAIDWIMVAKLAGELGIRYPTNAVMETFLQRASCSFAPSVSVDDIYAKAEKAYGIEYQKNGVFEDALKVALSSALSAQVQDVAGWHRIETAPTAEQLIIIGSYNAKKEWCAEVWSTDYLRQEQAKSASGFYKSAPHLEWIPTHWMPLPAAPANHAECRHHLGPLEIRLQKLITENPEKARLASSREDLRMWFIAELISEASGCIPLLEIEGLVSRYLAVAKGGAA